MRRVLHQVLLLATALLLLGVEEASGRALLQPGAPAPAFSDPSDLSLDPGGAGAPGDGLDPIPWTEGFVVGPNLYAYVRQNPWTSFDPDGLEEVKVDTSNPRFAEIVTRRMTTERQESPTANNISESAKKLPNSFKVEPKTSGLAETTIGRDGSVSIRLNPLTMNDATVSHETTHGIQLAVMHNYLEEVKKQHIPTKQDIDNAVEAARSAVNTAAPVKDKSDTAKDYRENEATRVTNIVNEERTISRLPADKKTERDFNDAIKQVPVFKQYPGQAPMAKGTEYGSYNHNYKNEQLKSTSQPK